MQRADKERAVAELTERLRTAQTLYVADYRGLSMTDIDELRTRLLEHGARFQVVKNTLTRRAAEAAGAEALLALLEGPTAIAFLEGDGDFVAVAKALSDAARRTRVLAIRGGVLEGRPVSADEVESLAKLPPFDALRGQVLGAVVAPLNALVALLGAPLTDFVGLIDARIEQLGGEGAAAEEPQGEAGDRAATAAESPVRESGLEEGVSGEPGGSPGEKASDPTTADSEEPKEPAQAEEESNGS